MPCYYPVKGYRSKSVNESGKRSIVFKPTDGLIDLPVTLPCGQCVGCRLERSRQWAIRCVHEASLHPQNSFITLTFDNEHLDPQNSLRKEDYQLFMKRLRKAIGKVRYFHCGEYGETNFRPHHHAILFGYQFPDLELWKNNNDQPIYISETLSKIWGKGFVTIGSVTFESCAYVARYIMKKITGDKAEDYYGDRIPPYNTMSRRPGIGQDWYNKYKSDLFPSDQCVIRADLITKPPKYYTQRLELTDPKTFNKIKRLRLANAKRREDDNTWDRLAVKEELKKSQLKQLIRTI